MHVGDCSAYQVHAATGTAEPLQVEHNRAAAYAGHDPARYLEARRQGMQNVLTRWVGMTADWAALDPQVLDAPDPLAPGDALVLCSDGLDKHVTRESIARAALALDARPRRPAWWRWPTTGAAPTTSPWPCCRPGAPPPAPAGAGRCGPKTSAGPGSGTARGPP